MIIKSLFVNNYRMLHNIKMCFDMNGNYLVGKNNIGKTSTLVLIATLLQGKDFKENDFGDPQKPIIIDLTLSISKYEFGIFDDNFSPDDANEITLHFVQENPDDRIKITDKFSNSVVTSKQIRKSNFVEYSSNIKPIRENDLTVNYGDYKLIPELVKNYISSNQPMSLPENDYNQQLITFLNENLKKIKAFNQNSVSVGFEMDYGELITRSLSLTDNEGIKFSNLGYGLQFSSLIPLKIIDMIISWNKYGKLTEHLIEDDDGKLCLNIILCIDEPEVHLHPNLQLKLMKYIRTLLSGNDTQFNSLLKQLFNINYIHGQFFAVTHSPNILSSNYHEIIRFFTTDDVVQVTSGSTLNFDLKVNKQLERQFPYFANALFSDRLIIVEGDSELAALPIFANKMNKSLIDNNVNIVKSDGVESIPSLHDLFFSLNISTVLISDRDDGKRILNYDNSFTTTKKSFEEECFDAMSLSDLNTYLKSYNKIIKNQDYDGRFWFKIFNSELKKVLGNSPDKFSSINKIIDGLSADEEREYKAKILNSTEFMETVMKNKSIVNGQLIADSLSIIPTVYSDAIKAAIQ
ncbi:ATP-dependent nuclease [Pediococcus siamensis]|uniref:ATP-dependent nuclease n=1 Tax=Pediococcus siamensis TaxID=381829 RepID=UPI0039A1D2C0